MDTQKNQIVDRLKQATNVLVTVSSNPSVDQLASAIGLTLLLNKLGKHATAVFSGKIPSTIEFLKPEDTLEKTTDSLRDFIIALDKSKADKLRYKVEDQMVKIFITPYRTSITDKDLEYSQGDFNVEVVLAIGVNEQKDLDVAITSHGRILHDATVIGINTHDGAELGSINWARTNVSSLSEMLVDLGLTLKEDVLDSQMATAFLTGIVAETERFSNAKTSSDTMQLSAKLMAAGANQQLVASQLQPPVKVPEKTPTPKAKPKSETTSPEHVDAVLPEVVPAEPVEPAKVVEAPISNDGSLSIQHEESKFESKLPDIQDSIVEAEEEKLKQIHIDEAGRLKSLQEYEAMNAKAREQLEADKPASGKSRSRLVMQPPVMGGKLTANSEPEKQDPSTDPLGAVTSHESMLSHDAKSDVIDTETELKKSETITDTSVTLGTSPNTLTELEQAVESPHIKENVNNTEMPPKEEAKENKSPEPAEATDLNQARDAVMQAVAGAPQQMLEPVQSLNAQPIDLNLGDIPAVATSQETPIDSSVPTPNGTPLQGGMVPIAEPPMPSDNGTNSILQNPTTPPPVPPPMMPPSEHDDSQPPLTPPVL